MKSIQKEGFLDENSPKYRYIGSESKELDNKKVNIKKNFSRNFFSVIEILLFFFIGLDYYYSFYFDAVIGGSKICTQRLITKMKLLE